MHLLGQVVQCRTWGPGGLGPPLHLLKTKARPNHLVPFRHPEWHRLRNGVWMPVPEVHGGAGFSSTTQTPNVAFGPWGTAAGTASTVALNSTYVYGVSGNSAGGRYRLPTAKTVNNIYFFISSYTGTAANVTTLLVEIRNDTSNLPGSTVHATQTKNPSSATGWINCSGLSYAGSADTSYWVLVANTSATAATDYATVLARYNGLDITSLHYNYAYRIAADSTNGWSTGTLRLETMGLCVSMSDSTTIGSPFSAAANGANNTERRGFYLGGFTETLKILGLSPGVASNNLTGIELYDATGTVPGTGAVSTGATQIINTTSTVAGYLFETAPTLAKASVYRLVFTYSAGANTSPRKLQIGTGADANLRAAMLGGGSMYWAQANGTTDWSNDDTSAQPQAVLLIEDQVAVASGSVFFQGTMDSGMQGRRYA